MNITKKQKKDLTTYSIRVIVHSYSTKGETMNININNLENKVKRENNWDEATWALASKEYLRFLKLRQKYPSVTLVPNELIDAVWHAHILNTEQYHADCDRLFGKYLHHVPHLDDDVSEENEQGYLETQQLFQSEFGEAMFVSQAARCQGKPCHAPTPCRCR